MAYVVFYRDFRVFQNSYFNKDKNGFGGQVLIIRKK